MLKKFVRAVDAINTFVGRYTALLLIPLVLVVFYEVVMRKIFNAPTSWAFEMTIYIYGFHFMMAMGVTCLHDKHVRIDIITLQLPPKAQLVLRLVTFWVIFLPFVGASSGQEPNMRPNPGCSGSIAGAPGSRPCIRSKPSFLSRCCCCLSRGLPISSAIGTS